MDIAVPPACNEPSTRVSRSFLERGRARDKQCTRAPGTLAYFVSESDDIGIFRERCAQFSDDDVVSEGFFIVRGILFGLCLFWGRVKI